MEYILTCVCVALLAQPLFGMKVTINSSVPIGELRHFWKSTGFCPPLPHESASAFDLSDDMVQNLAIIGSIPHGGVEQVRIHWLFDLVTVTSNKPFQPPTYNFTLLDQMIDLLYENGFRPGFELMGNPSNIFTSFEDKSQVMNWKDLVTQTAQRYIDQYGLGYVMGWNFETWNEPDCHDFDSVNMTVQGFLNYYDACSEGLRAASDQLRLGGPGDGCRRSEYSDALLEHVVNGINYFTGERGVRIDFLSYHKKGSGSSDKILNDEIALMKRITQKYPSLASKPFYNDEADPLVGWSKDESWRADSTYAAMVAKIVVQHQKHFISNPTAEIKNYTLLSNDNGFLSWYPHQFTQRTLLARFQINTTDPPHTHFFQKPVFSVMSLLSLLGEKQVQTTVTDDSGKPVTEDAQFGVLSSVHIPDIPGTSDSWQVASLVYFSNDTGPEKDGTHVDVFMDINPPSWASQDIVLVSWLLDNTLGNPYAIWEQYGKPDYPTLEQMTEMRGIEGASALFNITVKTGYQYLGKFFLQEPAVLLVHACSRPAYQPDQPNNVNVYNITAGQVLITWSDGCVNSRCILTYDIQYSKTDDQGSYVSIVTAGRRHLATSFVYTPAPKQGISPDELVVGFYKVRAIDYFINYSEFSLPTQYPDS